MMTSRVTVTVHCDTCKSTTTLAYDNAEKTSTLDNIGWRAVRDLIMTSAWFRIQFPDGQIFREFHVCGKRCAELLLDRMYQSGETTNVESSD